MQAGKDRRFRRQGVGGIALVYATAHFLVDFACAFFVWRCVRRFGVYYDALLLYNFCAFALQMPMGLLLDRLGNGRAFSALGCLVVAACLALRGHPFALCFTAGIGNALFHIGGGHDVLRRSGRSAGWLGVFVSPGAYGLFLGGVLGRQAFPAWPVPAALALSAGLILCLCPRITGVMAKPAAGGAERPWLMGLLLLFLVVCLRSYGGFMFRFPWKAGVWSGLFVLGVVLGKTVGGWLYDRLGGVRATVISLPLAAALFLGSANVVFGCAAVLLFNVTMPITLRAMADLLPGRPACAFGLLTLALFLGYLPVWLQWPALTGTVAYVAFCLVSLLMLLPVMLRRCA